MASITQENRSVQVKTVLPANTLLFNKLSGSEMLSGLFEYRVELISEDTSIDLNTLLGTSMTIAVELPPSDFVPAETYRFFNGIIAKCAHVSGTDGFAHYEFRLRPWFWLLTRTSDCRIFQNQTVPEVIKAVLSESGLNDVDYRLTDVYEPWRYCVQYNETDYSFLARLMEHEGIYYYFTHENGKHKLVLGDNISAHGHIPHYETVPFFPAGDDQLRERDHLTLWDIERTLQPGRFATRDFNFETPDVDLLATKTLSGEHANANFEMYNYPGTYPSRTGTPTLQTGENLVSHRIEEYAAQHEVAKGEGNAGGLATGCLFTLRGCDRVDQNREYLITDTHCRITLDGYRTEGGEEFDFRIRTTAISSKQQFRPPRVTPKPMVQGPQTAIVVGPKGEEIWTDNYGRIKVQFHWDRYGEFDENSSCWIRVSQPWAGKGWGGLSIPRIGQEVVVDFINGDPDRPIVTGRVYNSRNMPPYSLPEEAAVSGMKSATHKGAGYNEIAMNDTDKSQLMRMHAQHDMDTTVLNNQSESVGVNRTRSVGVDESVSVGNDRKKDVANNESNLVGNNRQTTIATNDSLQIGANQKVDVASSSNISVGQNKIESVGILSAENIGAAKTLNVGAGYQIGVGAAMNVTVGGASMEQVGIMKHIIAGSKFVVECGAGKFEIDSGGTITITGTAFNFSSSGPVKINGSVIDLN